MPLSTGVQAGAHTVTSTEANATTVTFTVNMVAPISYHMELLRSGVLTSLIGAIVTLTTGTETSGVWANGTLTVANGVSFSLTSGDVIYWMVG